MTPEVKTEYINCPCCEASEHSHWVEENGYSAVKCSNCGLIYVNPRPAEELITEAVQTGVHRELEHERTAIGHRVSAKVSKYKQVFQDIFSDVWVQNNDIAWLDVGAGFGEVVEAVSNLATEGSKVEGLEPMTPKATDAQARGLDVREAYLSEIKDQYDYVSLINVFSHIPDFHVFLVDIKRVLKIGGEFYIETGDVGDLTHFKQVPSEWDLPDHLVFASEENLTSYLEKAGFEVVKVKKQRVDGFTTFAKNLVKKAMGRQINLSLPYASPYRAMSIRAKYVGEPTS